MCTTIGFSYLEGHVFGRTLEIGVRLDNHIVYIPAHHEGFIKANETTYSSRYAVIGTGFFHQASLADGINEMGLMGSNNLLPGYASYSKETVAGKINLIMSGAFDYLLSRCKNVEEVREESQKLLILEHGESEEELSTSAHFFSWITKATALY
ncbi:linear amide C-N hydrolase [Sporosarcina sp. PTS2304]|uniref:linear amide C-N hydrolase n=1 Tax=Sporosarcina sp. PTS2304 TaxID=2283194 RepID=UPI000E0D27C6|nr:linear amide C-N hydrolase [Sporosarcina sp. PTS2304]AXI00182.1 linear amide C-N hydrolase [Sporosarcina sp. PTS2304]